MKAGTSTGKVSISSTSEEVVNVNTVYGDITGLPVSISSTSEEVVNLSLDLQDRPHNQVSISSTSEEVVNPTPLNPIQPEHLKPRLRGITISHPPHR